MKATWTDTIVKVMSVQATDPAEVADFTLPSRAQPIEARGVANGGSVCFVACYDDSEIKHSTNKVYFRRTDGSGKSIQKKMHFCFPTEALREVCVDDIDRVIANTKTPRGQPNPVELDVMNAIIEMLESHPAVVAYQVAHPFDELGYMMKVLDMIRKVDGCGGTIDFSCPRYFTSCLCGHDKCDKDVRYKDGTVPNPQFGLMHPSCALRYMNVRPGPSGDMIFDYSALGVEEELVNSDTGRRFFVTSAGASCPTYTAPTSFALLLPILHGTAIATALVESSTEKRKAETTRIKQLDGKREYNKEWHRRVAAATRAVSWQHYVATTGDTTSMSKEQVDQRCREVDQAIAKFKQKHGRSPFMQICDAKEIENSLGQMIIANKEADAFTQRRGAPFKKSDGDNFSRSQFGCFGSGADIEIEIGHKWELPSGRVSRDNETALILYCKKHFPGYTLNQKEVAQNTDIMAKRKNWDNRNRVNLLMLVDLLPALKNETAKLNPDPVCHMADVKRLKKHHPPSYFL